MWKKYIKNINAILFLISILCIYRSLLTGIGEKINAYLLMKIGLGFVEAEGLSQWFYSYIGQYLNTLAGAILVMIMFSVVTAIVLFFNKNRKVAHIIAIISAVICSIFVGSCYAKVNEIISEIIDTYSYWGEKSPVGINQVTIFLWFGCYVVIIALAVRGLCFEAEEKLERNDQDFCTYKGKEDIKVSKQIINNPAIYENKRANEIRKPNQQNKMLDFHGVIVGKKGFYQEMAYLLEEKREIFVRSDNELLEFSAYEENDAIMGIYYISEYQEYCVDIKKKKMVYLVSGQPLGADKKYYLPRGTEIYIKDDTNIFELS